MIYVLYLFIFFTGFETMNPYALQTAAFYQQALMGQPGLSPMERQ